jgi:sugar phosphate isomerase/epimerase
MKTIDFGGTARSPEDVTSLFDLGLRFAEIPIMKSLSMRVLTIHLHDNRGGDSHTDDLHLPPGEGVIDFKGLFEALHRIHYDRTVTLELKPHEIRQCLTYVSELVSGHSHGVPSR